MEIDDEKRITIYAGDRKQGVINPESIPEYIPPLEEPIQNIIGYSFEIAEFVSLPYEELIQIAVRNAYLDNPYANFEEDRLTVFLYWCDDYLFDFGKYEWNNDESGNKILWLSHFYYTKMTKYKDVITEKIFDRNTKICVLKTTKPLIKRIVNHINITEQSKGDVND